MPTDAARLRNQPLFASLSDDELGRLAAWIEIRTANPGDRLTPQGAAGYWFFVIEDGTAEVLHDGARVDDLGPGDFFGEMAILGDGRRQADVVATSPMTLFAVFGSYFREMEAAMPDVAGRIREAMGARLA
jgi:CRP-like cAMP-binding protein